MPPERKKVMMDWKMMVQKVHERDEHPSTRYSKKMMKLKKL